VVIGTGIAALLLKDFEETPVSIRWICWRLIVFHMNMTLPYSTLLVTMLVILAS
jgi:hypothetical protein